MQLQKLDLLESCLLSWFSRAQQETDDSDGSVSKDNKFTTQTKVPYALHITYEQPIWFSFIIIVDDDDEPYVNGTTLQLYNIIKDHIGDSSANSDSGTKH